MALVVADRVQETTTTTGTGTITLAGAVSGFQSFAVIGNGNTTYYAITSGSAWEVGLGTYSTTGPTLARTTILSSSAAGAAISLTGTSNVFVTYPAGKSVNEDASNNVTLPADFTVTGATFLGDAAAYTMGNTPKMQVSSTSGGASSINSITWAASTAAPQYSFGKSRGAASGTHAAVVADDDLGTVSFYGSNGIGFNRAAYIQANVNGTPGATNVPGRLVFFTGTNAASPIERMRIDSSGMTLATALTVANGGTGLTAGTSGGVPYFSAVGALSSSALLAANAIMVGGGAGTAPSTITTGTGVLTALGVAVGSAGSFTVNGGAGAFTTLTASTSAVISVNTSTDALRITQVGLGKAILVEDETNPDATPFAIDKDGNAFFGDLTAYTMGNAPKVQISSLAGGASSINAITWAGASATTAPQYSFGKSRGATAGTQTAVVAGDDLGFVSFYGSNGSGFNRAAYIKGQVNGTPGATNVPGRLAFYVGTDAAAPAEVMRVESTGVTVTGMGTFSSLGWTGVEYTAAGAALGPAIADYFTSTISLDASSIYDVECVAYFLKTTAGTATWTWTFSSAPDLISSFYSSSPLVGFITSTTGAPINAQAAARTAATLAHAATGSLTTAVYHVYRFKVLVRTNLATTMQLRVTSSAGTVTPQAGSFMRPTKVM